MITERLIRLAFALIAVTLTGCASAGDTGWHVLAASVIPEHDASTRAMAIDCRTYNEDVRQPAYASISIIVPVVVGADGLVKATGTAEVYPREEYDRAASRLGGATSIAKACVFEPATLDGEPIAVRTFVRFRYSEPRS